MSSLHGTATLQNESRLQAQVALQGVLSYVRACEDICFCHYVSIDLISWVCDCSCMQVNPKSWQELEQGDQILVLLVWNPHVGFSFTPAPPPSPTPLLFVPVSWNVQASVLSARVQLRKKTANLRVCEFMWVKACLGWVLLGGKCCMFTHREWKLYFLSYQSSEVIGLI